MRQQVLDYIKSQNLGTLTVSSDLPFEEGGVELYLKNAKTVYVDSEQKVSEPIVQTLGGTTISNQTTSVTIYFAIDAKQVIANYDTVVETLRLAKDITTVEGVNRRDSTIETEYLNDLLITSITVSLTRIR